MKKSFQLNYQKNRLLSININISQYFSFKCFADIELAATFASQYGKSVKRSVRLGVRTPGFHPGNRGSIPLRTTKKAFQLILKGFFYLRVVYPIQKISGSRQKHGSQGFLVLVLNFDLCLFIKI